MKLQRTPRRAARTALVSVRFTRLWLRPPEHLKELPAIAVTAILAQEVQAPVKEPPIRWLLLTTLDVPDFAMARQCLKWYSFRWLIELNQSQYADTRDREGGTWATPAVRIGSGLDRDWIEIR